MIGGYRLMMSLQYNKKHYKRETINRFWKNYHSELSRVIVYCLSRKSRNLTPSDLTYKKLSMETLERLASRYPIEDIYMLTPMQEGMLFNALYEKGPSRDFVRISYRLHGKMDLHLVEKSFNELFKRHDILRATFIYKEVERPLQLILKDRKVDYHYEDLRPMLDSETKEAFIKEFKEKDRQRSFDLSSDVLMRINVFQLDDTSYEFTWSFHHILLDGWCLGILNSEFFKIYNSLLANKDYRLERAVSYRRYIKWLEKTDKNIPKNYWREYLAGYEEPVSIPGKQPSRIQQERPKNMRFLFTFDIGKTARLNELARKNRVTLNIVIRSIWAVILGKYNGKQDVVFGAVVSGRPSEIEGVEWIVGLFINTIPVRITYEETIPFKDLLQKVQEDAVKGEPYHHYPLAQIQLQTPLKHHLLDHLLSFENYPIAQQLDGILDRSEGNDVDSDIKVSNVEAVDPNNYDCEILINPGEELVITILYNRNVYDTDYIKKIASHIEEAVEQVLENDSIRCKDIEISHQLAVIKSDVYKEEEDDFGF
jgi:hypothetical protein